MNHLARALESYYTKKDGKIIFLNHNSLNQLALQMWERLGCSQIDASVLSKVINGKRLFNPLQLEIFCEILGISSKERSYLLYCLNKDYCERNNIDLDTFFLPKENVLDVLKKCINEVISTGDNKETKLPQIIEAFTKDVVDASLDVSHEKVVFEILGASLYLKAKRLVNFKHGSLYIAENDSLSKVYASSPLLYQVFPRKTGSTMSVYRGRKHSLSPADYIVSVHPEIDKLGIGSDLVVPLMYKNKTFGVLSMLSEADTRFTQSDVATLENYLQ